MSKRNRSTLAPLKTPPIIEICNQQRIYSFLKERIKGQETSLNSLACILARLLNPHYERRVYKATLGGAQGSGKRTSVQAVKHLLGMDKGYLYESQFISLNGSAVSDNKAKAGGKDGVSLMKRLKHATETSKSPTTGKKETLPYICLVIDDVDKASAKFMDCVGSLFESGCYTMSGSDSFSIPKKTPLIVLFTTNCASSDIAGMKRLDDSVAAEMVRLTLAKKWPDGNLMKRMEPILPFYILKTETLRPILMAKFEEYVGESDITNRFGKGKIQYSDEVKRMLVDHVLVKVNTAHGIQGSISQLIRKLDIFFSTGLGVIDTLLSEAGGDQHHLMSPILVTAHSIDTNRFCESLDQQLDNVVKDLRQQSVIASENTVSTERVIDSILSNPENQQIMAECDTKQEGTVNAVAMAYGDISLCSLVMNITYNNYQVVNHLDQHEEVQYLKKKLRRYKNNLKDVIHTIDRTCAESSFNSTMKQIADSKRKLIESGSSSSGDDDDDEDDMPFYKSPRLPSSHFTMPMVDQSSRKRPRQPVIVNHEPELEHVQKRVRRIEECELLLDESDEIDMYIDGASDDEEIFTMFSDSEDSALSDLFYSSEEEEEGNGCSYLLLNDDESEMPVFDDGTLVYCARCKQSKTTSCFERRRKDVKTGEICIKVTEFCSTCRK